MSNLAIEQKAISTKKEKMYYIHSAIGVALMFLFGLLPPFGPVTPIGMKFLGIFIGLLYLWSTVDMGWPIFAAFVALIALDCMPITQIIDRRKLLIIAYPATTTSAFDNRNDHHCPIEGL